MTGQKNTILQKLLPHISLSEWGQADTETIMQDIMLAREKGLAISALAPTLTVLATLAEGTRIYCFIDDVAKLPEMAEQNITIQLFMKKRQTIEIPDEFAPKIIPSFILKDIEHLDWNEIIFSVNKFKAAGLMFIDDKGKFIHKFYAFLELIGDSFNGEVHYCAGTNDMDKLDSAYRLTEKLRPNLLPKLRLFVTRDFFRNLDKAAKSI
jgi:hypothetical protein